MSQRIPSFFAMSFALFAAACSADTVATTQDASTGQDAAAETGTPDSGNPDSSDGSTTDGSTTDGSTTDSGTDSGSFDVKNVPGLALWLDGSKGVTADGSGNVSKWADQSGNGNDAVQATANRQPTLVAPSINGKAVIRFNPPSATYPFLTVPDAATLRLGTGDFYITSVVKLPQTNASSLRCVLSKQDVGAPYAGYAMYLNFNTPHAGGQLDANTNVFTAGGPYGDGVARQFGFARASNTATIRVNGAVDGTLPGTNVTSDATGQPLSIGGVAQGGLHPLVGDLAELVVVKGAISPSDMAAIEAYLKAKYAL